MQGSLSLSIQLYTESGAAKVSSVWPLIMQRNSAEVNAGNYYKRCSDIKCQSCMECEQIPISINTVYNFENFVFKEVVLVIQKKSV